MYILKNALRNIARSKGRNILIGIIIFVIAVSLCIGLSIRQAAANARDNALEGLSITAQISVDRASMMKNFDSQSQSSDTSQKQFDKSQFGGFSNSLSVDELETYSKASTVQDFYYTLSTSLDATGGLDAVTSTATADEASTNTTTDAPNDMPSDMGGKGAMGGMGSSANNGDFSIIGYSGDNAMTDFLNGTSTITEGAVFEEGTEDYNCIISEELATYNSLVVGDEITLANPNNEDETYKLSIVGIYKTSDSADETGMGQMFSAADPANEIYMSYSAVKKLTDNSLSSATTTTDENGNETSTAVTAQTSGTYVFASVEDYETFTEEVYDLGLSEDYTVSSTDVNNFEQSLVPLETLSTIAGYFLIVIILIGALILVVLNIFSIRERKYEIGVLTAIGMKKFKVAVQFISEMLIVTLIAVIIGGAVGAASSVPVANVLLESQITSQQEVSSDRQQAFGRDMGGKMNDDSNAQVNNPPENSDNNATLFGGGTTNYVSEISSAVDIIVLLQLLVICILLAMVASAVSITAIMRYDPLRILSNRD